MGQVTLPYNFQNNTNADANQVDANFSAITTQVNGNLDSTNIKAGGVATSNLADGAVTPTKTEGIPWAQHIFGSGFIYSGLTATKDGTNANQLDVASGVIYITQTDGTLKLYQPSSTTHVTASASATYYLDFQPDGTWSFIVGHSAESNYITVATVTTDASGNISAVTQNSSAYNVTLLGGATGNVNVHGLSASGFNSVDYWL